MNSEAQGSVTPSRGLVPVVTSQRWRCWRSGHQGPSRWLELVARAGGTSWWHFPGFTEAGAAASLPPAPRPEQAGAAPGPCVNAHGPGPVRECACDCVCVSMYDCKSTHEFVRLCVCVYD